jgi:xylulokinase
MKRNDKAKFLLGVDCGTTACKAVLFDLTGRRIASETSEYGIFHPHPSWAEQDPDWWWDAVVRNVRNLIRRRKIAGKSVICVAVDSQREAVVPLDVYGKKLFNSIIWLDKRTIPIAKEIRNRLSPEMVIEKTGVSIDYFFSAAKILWIKKEKPQVFEQIRNIVFPKDYVEYKLTGALITDYSMASRTMLFDIRKRIWDEEICVTLGIPLEILPQIKGSWEIIGEVTEEAAKKTGLAKNTPVVCGGGDRPCEALGAGVITPGHVNVGTGTATAIEVPLIDPAPDKKGRIDCCCHVVPDTWEYEAVIMTTGASLRWFRDTFGHEEVKSAQRTGQDPYACFDKLAQKVNEGSDMLFYYPYLMGAKSPKFNDLAKGVFFGLTLGHSKPHFVRAILEGVAFQYIETLEMLGKLGVNVKEFSMVGGETKSSTWNRIKADILGIPIRIPEASETTAALGSAILAGVGARIYRSIEEGVERCIRSAETYNPRIEVHEKYMRIYEKYRKVYDSLDVAYKIITV